MANAGVRVRRLCILTLVGTTLVVSRAPSRAQGRFVVTDADIAAMKLNHYFDASKRSHDADFNWSFKMGEFVLKKGKSDIPTDLRDQLLKQGATADEIEGNWVLKDGQLVLTRIRTGTREGRGEVKLSVYKTAPTVVRIGYDSPQYVFAVER